MPAPSNDNIANAQVINGLSGLLMGSNVSASIETYVSASVLVPESGWPKFNSQSVSPFANSEVTASATVWYSFLCPNFPQITGPPGILYSSASNWEIGFTTDYPLIYSSSLVSGSVVSSSISGSNFQTVVQVFEALSTGSVTVGNIGEVSYLSDARVGVNNGASNGAMCSFLAYTGSQYYVRVGGRNNSQGNFKLGWSLYSRPDLGSCSNCPPSSDGTQIGVWQVPNVYQETPVDYTYTDTVMTLPCGTYEIKYCKGWYVWDSFTEGDTGGVFGVAPDSGSCDIIFKWNNNTGSWDVGAPSVPVLTYWNPSAAYYGSQCLTSGQFFTNNTTLTATFIDTSADDNINGSPNPVFEILGHASLAGASSSLLASNTGNTLTGSYPNWSGSFVINNTLAYPIQGVTASLENVDGISGASSPIIGTLAVGSNTFTYTFSAPIRTTICTANIALTVCSGQNLTTLSWPLYPIVTFTPTNIGPGSIYCNYEEFEYKIKASYPVTPLSYFATSSIAVVTTPSPVNFIDYTSPTCPNIGPNYQALVTTTDNLLFTNRTGTALTASLVSTVNVGTLALPSYTFTTVIPA